MLCISLAVLSWLSQFPSTTVCANWPFCGDVPLKNQPTSQPNVTLLTCSVRHYMHCISLFIIIRLSRFPSPQLAQVDLSVLTCREVSNQSINQRKHKDALRNVYYYIIVVVIIIVWKHLDYVAVITDFMAANRKVPWRFWWLPHSVTVINRWNQ